MSEASSMAVTALDAPAATPSGFNTARRQATMMHYEVASDLLADAKSGDPRKCRVAGTSVTTAEVAHTVRILGDFRQACTELGISGKQALQALTFFAVHRKMLSAPEAAEREESLRNFIRGPA